MFTFRLAAFAALFTAFTSATAQELTNTDAPAQSSSPSRPERRSDIGVFTQHGGPLREGEGSFNVQGGIYRWKKQPSAQTFWKIGAGVGSSFTVPARRTQPVSNDSAFNIETWKDERVYLLLGGVETQRHLRKGIYLTAGLEVQAGGSQGRLDSVARQIPASTNTTLNGQLIGSPVRLASTHQFFGTGQALLGVRFYSSRITGAMELFSGIAITAQTQTLVRDIPGGTYTTFNFNLGGAGTRFSLGYRF